MSVYGTGVLLPVLPVLNLAPQYHCSEDAFAGLKTQLALMLCFADFVLAMSAA